MKRNMKIIQINGFRGLLLGAFVLTCTIAGFVAFPGLVTKEVWNFLAEPIAMIPAISLIGGILLWSIILFSFFMFKKNKFIVSFNSPQNLSDDEFRLMMSDMEKRGIVKRLTPGDTKMMEEIQSIMNKQEISSNETEIKTQQVENSNLEIISNNNIETTQLSEDKELCESKEK